MQILITDLTKHYELTLLRVQKENFGVGEEFKNTNSQFPCQSQIICNIDTARENYIY